MFPTPIHQRSKSRQIIYKTMLPISLIIWLLPLAAAIMISIRSLADINSGNFYRWPNEFSLIENYTQIFTLTPMLQYFFNSIVITIPTVLGTLALSSIFTYPPYRSPIR